MMVAKKSIESDNRKLLRAMRALAEICELANDREKEYPERMGAIKAVASRSLHQNGDSRWFMEFNQQLELRLEGGP